MKNNFVNNNNNDSEDESMEFDRSRPSEAMRQSRQSKGNAKHRLLAARKAHQESIEEDSEEASMDYGDESVVQKRGKRASESRADDEGSDGSDSGSDEESSEDESSSEDEESRREDRTVTEEYDEGVEESHASLYRRRELEQKREMWR